MNLVFIKDWGNHKVGESLRDASPPTVKALVETYKVAIVQSDKELHKVLDQEIKQIEEETVIQVKKAPQRGRGSKEKKQRKR